MLPEGQAPKIQREVDTLVEMDMGLSTVRVAIECRAWKTPSDIQWVDQLIGKYIDLEVDQVIAVSESGFSAGAHEKANAHDIKLLTPEEVDATDWPSQFKKLGFTHFRRHLKLLSVRFETNPPLGREVPDSAMVRVDVGDASELGTVAQFISLFDAGVTAKINEYFEEHALELYKTRADLEKLARLETPSFPPSCPSTLIVDGSEYVIETVAFVLVAHNEIEDIPADHRQVGPKALLTSWSALGRKFTAAQTANSKGGSLNWDSKKSPPD